MNKIACTFMRSGTSKGPFLDLRDLPENVQERDKILLRIMGSPDKKQIDGIGGAAFVTSKVVMAKPSDKEGIDVDFIFAQVIIDEAIVDTTPTCYNMMAGVAPFAIEKGWIKNVQKDNNVKVKLYNYNTKSTSEITVEMIRDKVNYDKGDQSIDGVPGSASPILMKMFDLAGGSTGKLFPSNNLIDTILGKRVSVVDAGNLTIHMYASDFGLIGDEKPNYFKERPRIMSILENIRREVSKRIGLGDVSKSVLPKISLLSQAVSGGHIRSQYFTPKKLHPTHAVSGAISIATAIKCKGTVAADLGRQNNLNMERIEIEHPAGLIPIEIEVSSLNGNFEIISASVYRTARKLMDGYVYF